MDATAFTSKGNHDAQRTDTTDGINKNIGQSRFTGEKFSAELHKLLDSGCPFLKPPHKGKGDALVDFGTVTVPDEPGVKCKGGHIEISPLWPKPGQHPGQPSDDQNEHHNWEDSMSGPADKFPPGVKPVRPIGSADDGGGDRPGADDHRRPYRPITMEDLLRVEPLNHTQNEHKNSEKKSHGYE